MKKNNIKQSLSNEKGITLISLIVTVVVMLLIVAVSVNTGTDSIDDTKLKGFYTQLEIIQKRVDAIANNNEGYYITNADGTKTYIDLKTAGGSAITSTQTTFLQGILDEEGITTPASEFRYFTTSDLEEQMDLLEIDYNVFVHFDTRTIVSDKGITANGKVHYVLIDKVYFIEQDTTKNAGRIELTYNITKLGTSNYKITVIPSKVGDLNATGTLRYKKATTKYWETADSLEIVINELAEYNIEYVDNNQNTVSEIITIALDDDGNPTVTVNE